MYVGGCVTPPNALVSTRLQRKVWFWSLGSGVSDAGRSGRCIITMAWSLPSSPSGGRASLGRLCLKRSQGVAASLWIVFCIFLYSICMKTPPHPVGEPWPIGAMAIWVAKGRGHSGGSPLVIYIYIYTITKAIPSCPWCLLRLHPLRLCVLLLHLFLLPVLCKNCFEGTPPWGHMSKIFKYIYVVEQALLPSPGERWAMR